LVRWDKQTGEVVRTILTYEVIGVRVIGKAGRQRVTARVKHARRRRRGTVFIAQGEQNQRPRLGAKGGRVVEASES
jgi:hypothetical protein